MNPATEFLQRLIPFGHTRDCDLVKACQEDILQDALHSPQDVRRFNCVVDISDVCNQKEQNQPIKALELKCENRSRQNLHNTDEITWTLSAKAGITSSSMVKDDCPTDNLRNWSLLR